MTTTTTMQPVQLNDGLAANWKHDAGPVAILNPDATLHERIAYCWGLAAHLEAIANLSEESQAPARSLHGLLLVHLVPLLAVLDNLGTETRML
jgi:hypothetical protein